MTSAIGLLFSLDGSEELSGLLESLGAASVDGEPRFTPITWRSLCQLIASREYATALLGLCHLVRVAALATNGRFEDFFQGVPLARTDAYVRWIHQRFPADPPIGQPQTVENGVEAKQRVMAEKIGVTIAYPERAYGVYYQRMPLLAALMDFLVAALGKAAVVERLTPLLAPTTASPIVAAVADDLRRELDAFLAAHLPLAKQQGNLERLLGFLKSRHGENFQSSNIGDADVLSFWAEAAEAEEFPGFMATFAAFLRLVDALEAAATAGTKPAERQLGADSKGAKVDLVAFTKWRMENPSPYPLGALAEPPADRIKVLTASERDDLALVAAAGERAPRFPLSILRADIFGRMQARVGEAWRAGGASAALDRLAALLPEEGESLYDIARARHKELTSQLERLMLAGLHVLAPTNRIEPLVLLGAIAPEFERRSLMPIDWIGRDFAESIMKRVNDPSSSAAYLMQRARHAFNEIDRVGYDAASTQSAEILEGHIATARPLIEIAKWHRSFCDGLDRRDDDEWAALWVADRDRFRRRFAELCGR